MRVRAREKWNIQKATYFSFKHVNWIVLPQFYVFCFRIFSFFPNILDWVLIFKKQSPFSVTPWKVSVLTHNTQSDLKFQTVSRSFLVRLKQIYLDCCFRFEFCIYTTRCCISVKNISKCLVALKNVQNVINWFILLKSSSVLIRLFNLTGNKTGRDCLWRLDSFSFQGMA